MIDEVSMSKAVNPIVAQVLFVKFVSVLCIIHNFYNYLLDFFSYGEKDVKKKNPKKQTMSKKEQRSVL